jgi:hypothetical protein
MKISLSREDLHLKVYMFSLALLVCCLPLSRYLLSVSQLLMALNWIAEGNFRNKILKIRQKPDIILFASVFVLYAVGLLFSENTKIGLEKVKNALPLLMMPIVLGTSSPLSVKTIRRLLILFSSAVIAAAIVCMLSLVIKGLPPGGDFRDISVFMLHIRFSLLIDFAIVILLYFANFTIKEGDKNTELFFLLAGAVFLTGFLFYLRSATGIVIFILVATLLAVNFTLKSTNKRRKHLFLSIITAFYISLTVLVLYTWYHNFTAAPVIPASLETHTQNGNSYAHDAVSGILENGHYVDLYVSETELEQEWNTLSDMPYDGSDLKGQMISSTIKRYLTSRGLRKDSAGIHALTSADYFNIEKGQANFRFHDNPGLYQRLYETLWEIHVYIRIGFVQEHSIGQRLAFYRTALALIRERPWHGTGSGDVYSLMHTRMLSANIAVDPEWEGKPHNQYAFLLLGFGLAGFIWILGCWIYPVMRRGAWRILLFNLFFTIILVSMLVMDTLESYDSMVFFAFFYCLFVFNQQKETAIPYNEMN